MATIGVFENVMSSLGLTARPQQAKLVGLARDAVADDTQKFVQAGTGTGKSFAVLSVALEAARETGHPSIVICPNNTLIDQYVVKDAPRIAEAAGGKFVHIKGRSRYLCANSRAFSDLTWHNAAAAYRSIVKREDGQNEWANIDGLTYEYGCPGADECDSTNNRDCFCGFATGDRNDGKGCDCPFVCGAFQAKYDAQSADVVITNAHVLVWDYLVRQFTANSASLLPDAGTIFVDECHELESVGRGCLGVEIKPNATVYELLDGLRTWADKLFIEMQDNDRSEGLVDPDDPDLHALLGDAKEEQLSCMYLADQYDSGDELAKLYRRQAAALGRFIEFATNDEDGDFVSIIERAPDADAVTLSRKCVDASLMFNQILTKQPSILVSGTIPGSTPKRLGLGATIDNVGHPFDYSKSTLAISNLGPRNRADTFKRAEQVSAAINDTGGGTLILFTSWADMELVVPTIVKGLRPEIAREVYVQSKDDPSALKQDVADFAAHGNAVLIGVRSLFTGLDVPGPALRQVIIWKLPYAVPSIEVKAIEKKHGKQVYYDEMLMILMQGVGRLIRTTDDTGRIFIADNRAQSQRWAASPMTRHMLEFSAHRRRPR